MTTKVVESENPIHHWSDVQNVEGKKVLDLGCGWLFQPFESTPEYFIKRGASKIIGVDSMCREITQLKETYPEHEFICKSILELDDLVSLITEHRPEVIKMDIEGYEKHMKDVTADQFASVEEVAIEYHNPNCKKILEDKLNELGFEIFSTNQFGWFCTDLNQMGIIHAKR